jgi:hypothetical protein
LPEFLASLPDIWQISNFLPDLASTQVGQSRIFIIDASWVVSIFKFGKLFKLISISAILIT